MICNAGRHSHTKVSILRPHETKVDVLVPRYRKRKPCSRSETPSEKPWSRPRHRVRNLCGRRHQMTRRFRCRYPRHHQIIQGFTLNWNPCPRHNFRLDHWNWLSMAIFASNLCYRCLSMNLEWKYEFKMSSFTTTILNLLFAEADQKGKTRNFQTYIGPGSNSLSADKLSLDLKFNPWDTAITFRLELLSMSKSLLTHSNLCHRAE